MNFIDLLKAIWEALAPIVVVRSYQRGVRWTWGSNPKTLEPRVHFKLWPIHDIEVISVAEAYFDTNEQTVTTLDGKAVIFSATIGYRIVDPVKHFCEVDDFTVASEAIAMAHLSERIRAMTYEQLGDLKGLESSLKGTLTTRVKDWGTEIVRVSFINFVHVPRQLRLWGGLRAPE